MSLKLYGSKEINSWGLTEQSPVSWTIIIYHMCVWICLLAGV
jgi:hypothetical protein